MGETFAIKQGPRAKLAPHIERATELIRDGKIIVAPLESAYVFVCDAFTHQAIADIHRFRGDKEGTACQVIVGDAKTASGVSINFQSKAQEFADKFWPGLLTINIAVQKGLTWDLGDKRELGQVSLRVPQNRFMLELAKSCGPLAVASAARAGMKPARELFGIPALQSEIAANYDAGEIAEGVASTVIEIAGNEAKIVRIGAITLEELQTVDPNIVVPS